MSEQPRRRFRTVPSPRRVGEPNVLSNQAIPNRLSTQASPGVPGRGSMQSPTQASAPPRSAAVQPTIATGRPVPVAGQPGQAGTVDDRFERPRGRPKLGTIITIGFLIFWALRFFDTSGIGGGGSTPTPRPTARPGDSSGALPTQHAARGEIVFGEVADGASCSLEKRANRFTIDVDVYWEAEMQHVVAGDATVLLVEKRDNVEIDRQEVPPDPDVGSWVRFCGGGPVAGYQPGVYRLEIWNEDETEILSSGLFTRYDPSATASPRPSRGPLPTVLGSQTGNVTFGTVLGEDCALSGLGDSFPSSAQIWWRADLKQPIPADSDVRVVMQANLATIADEIIVSESVPEPRSVICATAPIPGKAAGYVYVWVWNVDQSKTYATGLFRRTP